MESPEQLGRMAVRLKLENRQHYKDNSMKIAQEESMAKDKRLSYEEQILTDLYKHLLGVLSQHRNLPSVCTDESFVGIILLFSAISDLILARWTIAQFSEIPEEKDPLLVEKLLQIFSLPDEAPKKE